MNILYLAPQPFFIERGTPIAVRMSLEVMDARGDDVDLITYHEGTDVLFNNVRIHRTPSIRFLTGVRAGFSLKKLACDVLMAGVLLRLMVRRRYDVIHAVEESVFLALIAKLLFGTPYVYDMDSSLAEQLTDKYPRMRVLHRFLTAMERLAVRNALGVVAVCDELGETASAHGARKLTLLYDVPMKGRETEAVEDLRGEWGLDGDIGMYIGNMESYQGIDLLLQSIATLEIDQRVDIVLIGGATSDIERYRLEANRLGVSQKVHFLGPRPLEAIYAYLEQADFLISPRTSGRNTPMKIYSYLASGKPIVATRLRTHTQALDDGVALLAEPKPEAFADAIGRVCSDQSLRERLGLAGKERVAERYNRNVFVRTLRSHLEWVQRTVGVSDVPVRGAGEAAGA